MRYLPKLAGAVTRDRGSYEYLGESIRSWPDQLGLAAHMRDAGWGKIGYRNLSGGIVALHRATKQ
jgi:demethylmenaquinone methyltransferase/2-methoxy-6-polyprenyl-1,4-benzoquinol methylase